MTQLPSDKYTMAWFKLAEFVNRKEKERALGIYRLLVHSLQDDAFALQVEADLLLSFGDAKALDKYAQAAEMYIRSGKYIQAAGIYEHCSSLKPEMAHYYAELSAQAYAQQSR